MRTRFGPSPTGLLHVGGLRTALYAYLVARQTGGEFLVRVEDTDQARSVDGAIENMLRTLHWAGIDPDEGVMLEDGKIVQKGDCGPYIQSERLEIYKKHAQELIDNDHAYYAFDTPEEIEQMKQDLQKAGHSSPNYNAAVRMRMKNSLTLSAEEVQKKLEAGEPYTVRFKVDTTKPVHFTDEIRGRVEFDPKLIDDQVLLKSDGFPTYHLAHVVDDHLMKIDIIIRGEEWLSSLPKHLLMFEAFGWDTPKYAHVPLLLNADRSKLSKRQNDVAAEDYITRGYLPEAMLNFLAMLGWNSGTTQELYSLEDLIKEFSLKRVQKGGAIFDIEKLDWLQGQWMRNIPPEEFASEIQGLVAETYPEAKDDKEFQTKATLIQDRITFLQEAPDMLSFFYDEPSIDIELLANKKQKVKPEILPEVLELLDQELQKIDDKDWNDETLKEKLFAAAKKHDYKNGQVLWPLRALLTGQPYSPGAFEVAAVLGKDVTLKRLHHAQEVVA